MTHPLEIIGHIEVPADALMHRFVIEAAGCAKVLAERDNDTRERVVGTANTGDVELYGWAPNVPDHQDNTGLVYLVALNPGTTMIECIQGEVAHSVVLEQGAVVRLDDRWTHWTIDLQERICAFIGSFEEPCDEWAINRLQAAVEALERGDYYGAPRVQHGFRVYGADECLVADTAGGTFQYMLLVDAIAQDRLYETCCKCGNPATILDRSFPYFTEHYCYNDR